MGPPRGLYMAKTDKERLATGFWNRIESNQAADCNTVEFKIYGQTVFTLVQPDIRRLKVLSRTGAHQICY